MFKFPKFVCNISKNYLFKKREFFLALFAAVVGYVSVSLLQQNFSWGDFIRVLIAFSMFFGFLSLEKKAEKKEK